MGNYPSNNDNKLKIVSDVEQKIKNDKKREVHEFHRIVLMILTNESHVYIF